MSSIHRKETRSTYHAIRERRRGGSAKNGGRALPRIGDHRGRTGPLARRRGGRRRHIQRQRRRTRTRGSSSHRRGRARPQADRDHRLRQRRMGDGGTSSERSQDGVSRARQQGAMRDRKEGIRRIDVDGLLQRIPRRRERIRARRVSQGRQGESRGRRQSNRLARHGTRRTSKDKGRQREQKNSPALYPQGPRPIRAPTVMRQADCDTPKILATQQKKGMRSRATRVAGQRGSRLQQAPFHDTYAHNRPGDTIDRRSEVSRWSHPIGQRQRRLRRHDRWTS